MFNPKFSWFNPSFEAGVPLAATQPIADDFHRAFLGILLDRGA